MYISIISSGGVATSGGIDIDNRHRWQISAA